MLNKVSIIVLSILVMSIIPANMSAVEASPDTIIIGPPTKFKPTFLDELPELPKSVVMSANKFMEKPRIMPKLQTVAEPLGPVPGTEVNAVVTPLDVVVKDVVNIPTGYKSEVNEPSLANRDNIVFYTGNWYAAASSDNGDTWSFINPFVDMPDFCCDQDVIYDNNYDLFIWYRQGIPDLVAGENRVFLSVAHDITSWCTYVIESNTLFPNEWLDYPHIATSNNYLYITSNMFDNALMWQRTIIMRLPLNDLSNCAASVTVDVVNITDVPTVTPVQGATDTIYFGAHETNTQFRIYSWPETSSITYVTRSIDPWLIGGDYTCAAPDGGDACQRSDGRVLAGFIADWDGTRVVGFMWNVGKGAGFPYPYVNAAIFRESDLSYMGRPYIWNPDYAYIYPAAAPNMNYDLGLTVFSAGGGRYPTVNIGIYDQDSPNTPAPWELYSISFSTNGPGSNKWGDYIRVRQYNDASNKWISSGYILDGCNNSNCIVPKYYTFGRFVPDASIKAMQNGNEISVSNPAVLGADIDCVGAIDYNDANDFECTLFDGDGNVIDSMYTPSTIPCPTVFPSTYTCFRVTFPASDFSQGIYTFKATFTKNGNVINIQGPDFRVASFFVLPETAIGAIAVFAAIFGAFIVYSMRRR